MCPHSFDHLFCDGRCVVPVEDVVSALLTRLRALAHRMLKRHPWVRRIEDTDDLLQNAAIRMRRAFAAVEPDSPQSLLALATKQLQWELVDLIRRHRRYAGLHHADPSWAHATINELEAHNEDLADWTAFHEAVAALPQEQRESVHFLWYLGMSQPEAAKLLGTSERTLRRNWRLARDSLRTRLRGISFGDD